MRVSRTALSCRLRAKVYETYRAGWAFSKTESGGPGIHRTSPAPGTAIAYSTSSSRSPGVSEKRQDGSAFALTYILRFRSCRFLAVFIISSPLPFVDRKICSTVGSLRSTGITPLHRYCGPFRHPLVFDRLPGFTGYTAYLASVDFSTGRGGLLQLLSVSLSPCHRYHPAGVDHRLSQSTVTHAAFTLRLWARPPSLRIFEATSAFICITAQ